MLHLFFGVQIAMVQNDRPKLHQTSMLQYPGDDQVMAAFLPQFLAKNGPASLASLAR